TTSTTTTESTLTIQGQPVPSPLQMWMREITFPTDVLFSSTLDPSLTNLSLHSGWEYKSNGGKPPQPALEIGNTSDGECVLVIPLESGEEAEDDLRVFVLKGTEEERNRQLAEKENGISLSKFLNSLTIAGEEKS